MKTVVVYYSFEGNTKVIAEEIAHQLKCELVRLKPVKELKSKGFTKYIWGGKQAVMKAIPKLEKLELDLNAFDRVIVGTPIWAGTISPAVRTLFMKILRDKPVILFYCHLGGDDKIMLAKEIINKHNHLIEMHGFLNVEKNRDENIKLAKTWAESIK